MLGHRTKTPTTTRMVLFDTKDTHQNKWKQGNRNSVLPSKNKTWVKAPTTMVLFDAQGFYQNKWRLETETRSCPENNKRELKRREGYVSCRHGNRRHGTNIGVVAHYDRPHRHCH